MNKIKNYFTFFFISFFMGYNVPPAISCSCWPKTFCELVEDSENEKVVKVEILNKYGPITEPLRYMDVKVLEHIYGIDTLSFDTITITQHDPICFGISNYYFSTGDTLLFMFNELSSEPGLNTPSFNWTYCAIRYLKVSNGLVTKAVSFTLPYFQNIAEGILSTDYQDFINDMTGQCYEFHNPSLFNKYGLEKSTPEVNTSIEDLKPNTEVSIFPNPSREYFVIKNLDDSPLQFSSLKIYSSNGELIKQVDLKNASSKIFTQDLSSGIYFIKLYGENEIVSKKLVKI